MSRAEIIDRVRDATGMIVQTGPFAGMRMAPVQSWGNGEDIGPQLLGVYEAELHPWIARAVARPPATILNVGCAEGYYAIGLARLLPQARVHAFDTDPAARAACATTAELNGVAARLKVAAGCTPARIATLARGAGPILAIIDCEGCEKPLLTHARTRTALAQADIIVETHDFMDPTIGPSIQQAYEATHDVACIASGARNPHAFTFLDGCSDADKWMLVCENRPELQIWIALWHREAA